jgi:PPOX class probable F420-dependent enzyme
LNISYAVTDGGLIRISITDDRAKAKNLRRDPRASLYVGRRDFSAYVVVEGTVELSAVSKEPGDAAGQELIDLFREVQGEEHPDWDEYNAAMVSDKRLVARLLPERAYGFVMR